ncbi:MAG: uroporphyrinogen decarboxylase [Bdellovibrionales bacterium]|nr:uroporphyrinogen decarboxylase [Bdellovibrionales bacterium]
MNPRFQAAIRAETQSIPPVWMMRQAGRYHRHYQALRKQNGFMELCKNPRLAAEVALGPIQDFDFDVSILFSDLLFPLEALGMGLDYDSGPPRLAWSLDPTTLRHLLGPEEALPALEFQKEAMRLTRQMLPANKSLIGFVGGPWTLLGYAVDGSHQGGLRRTQQLAPEVLPPFFEILVPLLERNISLQLEGGAEAVLILDTAAGELDLESWKRWVLPSLSRLAQHHRGKVGYYMRGATQMHWSLLHAARLPLAGVGFDAGIDLCSALREREQGFIQGNFHQEFMALPESEFRKKFEEWLDPIAALSPEKRTGWVCGVGHGLTPHSREENVRQFVKMIRERFA